MGTSWRGLTVSSKNPDPKALADAVFIALSTGDQEKPIWFEIIGENTLFFFRVEAIIGRGKGRRWLIFGKRG